jgi:hypothetical protein
LFPFIFPTFVKRRYATRGRRFERKPIFREQARLINERFFRIVGIGILIAEFALEERRNDYEKFSTND